MSLATFDGSTVATARLNVPAWGCWWAGVDLTEPETKSGALSLVVADQAMACAVVSGGVADGRASYRAVGGAGGWGKRVGAQPYADDSGVALSKVLTDLAREVGETIADIPSTTLGPHYARPACFAYEVLNLLAPKNWYVDFDGVTHIGQRPASTYTGSAPRTRRAPGIGVIDLAVDSLAGLVPGVQVDGSNPATDIEIELSPERLTARVYANESSTTTERLEAIAQVLAALDPRAKFRCPYEYRVVIQTGDRFALQPVYAADNMPDLDNVPARGPAGIRATVLPGEQVLVAFPGGDPSRPCVVAHDLWDSPGWLGTLAVEVGGPAALPIAYQGSPVVAGPFAGTVVLGSTLGKVRP